MSKALIFAGIAAIGNALFVYGQRRASNAANPFIFMTGAVIVCSFLFIIATTASRTQSEITYLSNNLPNVCLAGAGLFVTFVGFYFLYTQYGAVYYVVYAVISIITTSIIVGVFIFKEPFSPLQVGGLILALLSILMFSLGQTITE